MKTNLETLNESTSTLDVSLDMSLYPQEVLYAAAYVFLDRAYVLLDRVGERFVVSICCKQQADEATLRNMAGEFENELLAQALRLKVFQANRTIIERVTSLAIFGAVGPAEVAASSPDPADGFLEDPLGIAAPWESKKS